jgi:hypothetical protein
LLTLCTPLAEELVVLAAVPDEKLDVATDSAAAAVTALLSLKPPSSSSTL